MAYLVLARKYRPQTLEDVLGQDHVTTTLRNAIAGDRVAHAYLFTGARGVGKTSSARILAKALNCEKGPTTQPCNTCENCREITEGHSLDVFEIDAASHTGVDHVRELQEGLRYAPNRSRFKIYIIDEVHMLSTAAFNALLKTLEEPPPYVRFIFATTEPHKIPVTILSRCQRFDFKRLSRARIVERLAHILRLENIGYTPMALQLIAREAEGSMRDALSLTDQALSFGGGKLDEQTVVSALGIVDRQLLGQTAEAILASEPQALLEIVEWVYDFGLDVRQFLKNLLEYFRNLLVVKVASDPTRLVDLPPEDIEELRRQTNRVELERLHRLFSALLRLGEDVARSAHPRMALEVGLVRIATLGPLQPIENLLGALRDMARRPPPIAGGTGPAIPAMPPTKASPRSAVPTERVSPSLPPPQADEAFLAYCRRVSARLAAYLDLADIQPSRQQLYVRLPKEQAFLHSLLTGSLASELESLASAYLGNARTKVVVEVSNQSLKERGDLPTPASRTTVTQPHASADLQLVREMKEHPTILDILRVFGGGTIKAVIALRQAPRGELEAADNDDGAKED